jgi:hypothetical protein
MHILLSVDTTQATAANRIRLYVNGDQVSAFSTSSDTSQNFDTAVNTTTAHRIGSGADSSGTLASYFDGYLAECFFIDGQALTPTSFTTTDSNGELQPKTYAGTYGTNGFKLNFSDNSTTAALGTDSSGTDLGNRITTPASNAPPTVDYLIVGGGGGAGGDLSGGGGGGGVLASSVSLTSSTSYVVAVGTGGAGDSNSSAGLNGGNSSFNAIIALGGGGGAGDNVVATTGGSGGGGSTAGSSTAPRTGAAGTIGQGSAGGNGFAYPGGAGGGGGAGQAGSNGGSANGTGGNGGNGVQSSITGTAVYYGGGGGGGGDSRFSGPAGTGGLGGGGNGGFGTSANGTNGTANTGGGGGGGSLAGGNGGNGGSGIVIIRYANTYADLSVGGGLTYSFANTGGYKIYTFTASIQDNNWTVNNFSVSTTSVSSIVSGGGGSLSNAVDNSETTYCAVSVGAPLVFNFSSIGGVSYSSSVVVRVNTGGGSPMAFNVNGAGYGSYNIYNGDQDVTVVSGSGTLNTLSIDVNAGGGANFYALKINGSIFVINPAGNDSLVDTPTSYGTPDTGVGNEVRGNYCTLNPLFSGTTLTNGNLDAEGPSNNWFIGRGTIAFPNSAKWYFEATITGTASASYAISVATAAAASSTGDVTTATEIYGIVNNTSTTITKFINGTASTISTAAAWAQGDILMCAYDGATSKVWFGRNGTWYPPTNGGSAGNPGAGTNETMTASGTVFPAVHCYGTNADMAVNFGQRAFNYTAPTNFKALVDTNLPTPTIAKPDQVFQTKLYTGNGGTQNITGLAFSPDFVWLKKRNGADNHCLFDTVRTALQQLVSNSTAAETTSSATLTAFNSDGFTVGGTGTVNENGSSYVGWTWDAGTSTVANTAGSITSQVRANPSAGFSIVTYTGTGANATVGHGLGVAPSFIIGKSRSAIQVWPVGHTSIGWLNYLLLNATDAFATGTNVWNSTNPSSTVVSLGSGAGLNASGSSDVMYCFAPVSGYSSFGSYVGNGSTDGTFVYTGFRPKWILVKNTGSGNNWEIYDATRDPYNVAGLTLLPNTADAEIDTRPRLDLLSNGFKWRSTGGSVNGSGSTIIYAAFAESPLQYSRAR